MISENELRVGNYFIHNGNWNTFNHKGIFKWTESEWFALGKCTISLDDIKPIPLTEEILLKCGFEYWGFLNTNEYENYHRYVIHNIIDGTSNFELHKVHSNYGENQYIELIISIDKDERINTFYDLKYLHQLQNIYWCLCGKELEINL